MDIPNDWKMLSEIEYEVEVRQELIHTVRVKATSLNNARREGVKVVNDWLNDAIDQFPVMEDLCQPSLIIMSVHEVCSSENGE